MILDYKIKNNKYITIKQILKEEFKMSDRLILKLKTNKRIFLNNIPVHINHEIKTGDILSIDMNFIENNSNIVSTKMDLEIIYEDEYMLILNKPAGIAIHPSQLHFDNSLSNGVKFHFDSIGLKRKIRPVNRLDKDTSRNCYFCKKRIHTRMLSKTNEK